MSYYRILDDLSGDDRWFLGKVTLNGVEKLWEFITPKRQFLSDGPYEISIRSFGSALDFTYADFEVPIVNQRVADLLKSEEVLLLPVTIPDVEENHYIAVVRNYLDCVDEQKSQFEKYLPDDPIRPDKVGQYRVFFKLVINPLKTANCDIFKIDKYSVVIIVSERLKDRFEKNNIRGIKFVEV